MKSRLIIIHILNVIDLIATLYLVSLFGLDIEANPIGRWLIKTRLVYLVKIVVVGIGLYALYRINGKVINVLSWVLLGIFVALCVYHLIILILVNL